MSSIRDQLARQGIQTALLVRDKVRADLQSPVCIYGICDKLGVSVRFVEINSMEGMYSQGPPPTILLGSGRPLQRRNFTCGHELGHHIFGHGSTIDELQQNNTGFQPNEFLVNSFASALLMPLVGLRRSFAIRKKKPEAATPLEIFSIACHFGVGYDTLVNHLAFGVQMVSPSHAKNLDRITPKQIREELLQREVAEPLIVMDEHWSAPTVDLEVGTFLAAPKGAVVKGTSLVLCERHKTWELFQAKEPGIAQLTNPNQQLSVFARISRFQFVGLSRFRHLEEVKTDE